MGDMGKVWPLGHSKSFVCIHGRNYLVLLWFESDSWRTPENLEQSEKSRELK